MAFNLAFTKRILNYFTSFRSLLRLLHNDAACLCFPRLFFRFKLLASLSDILFIFLVFFSCCYGHFLVQHVWFWLRRNHALGLAQTLLGLFSWLFGYFRFAKRYLFSLASWRSLWCIPCLNVSFPLLFDVSMNNGFDVRLNR